MRPAPRLGPLGIVPALAALPVPLRWCVRDSRGFYFTREIYMTSNLNPAGETWTSRRALAYTYERAEAEAIAARFEDAIVEAYS